MKNVALILIAILPLFGSEYFMNNGERVYLKELDNKALKSRNLENSDVVWYSDSDGNSFGVGDEIIVVLKDKAFKDDVIDKYSLNVVENISSRIFVIKVKNSIFSLANKLYEDSRVKVAQPSFVQEIELR